MSDNLPAVQANAVERRDEPSLMQVIFEVSKSLTPDSVLVMKELVAMKERAEDRAAEKEFIAALVAFQSEVRQVKKTAPGQGGTKFAPLEDIDAMIQPLLEKHGFALTFDEEEVKGQDIRYSSTLSHRGGHSGKKYMTLALDKGGQKNGTQAAGSSASYAQRYLTKKWGNIVEKGEDTDGDSPKTITADQALDIETLITDTKSDKAKFLKLVAGVDSIPEILARDYKRVISNLEEKLQMQQRKAQQ